MSGANEKPFDFEVRPCELAQQVRQCVKRLPRTIGNIEDVRQLIRSSGSVGANYIEANESLGKRDFKLHLRIARKEAKESRYWLRLLETGTAPDVNQQRENLVQESGQLLRILSAMLRSAESGNKD